MKKKGEDISILSANRVAALDPHEADAEPAVDMDRRKGGAKCVA